MRDLPRPKIELRDTVPEQVGVYVAPRPLAPTSDHRTIQIKPVVLAAHLDPRRAPTELRLSAPPPFRQRRLGWIVPLLGLAAVALGALLATRFGGPAEAPPMTATPVEAPVPAAAAPPGAPALDEARGANAPSSDVRADGTTGAPEIAFTALPTAAPPATSAPTRKKKREPWLE